MTNEELEVIEAQKQEAKAAIEKGEALKRLLDNDDYKLIVQQGFIEDYAKELGQAIASNTGQYDSDKLVANLRGIGAFTGYAFQVGANYNQGIQTVEGLDELIADSVNEDEV